MHARRVNDRLVGIITNWERFELLGTVCIRTIKGSRVTVDTPRSLEHLGLIASPILPAILDAIPCMSSRRSLKDVFEQDAANETSLRPRSWKRATLEARVLLRVF